MLKRYLALALCILAVGAMEVNAQAVKIKRQAISPYRRVGVPTYPYYVSTGMRIFAKGMKVYFSADTTGSLTNTVTSFDWTFVSKPAGSNATITTKVDSASFIGDVKGQYIIQCSVNGGAKTAQDTLFASTYVGYPTAPVGCQTAACHGAQVTSFEKTNHATIFMRGITGQLEVDSAGMGAYGKSCVRCHTTGWESATDNGNFGYIANQTKWDSTWWKALPYASGDYWMKWKDMTLWTDLTTNYPTLVPVAKIGCESCHGPAADHNGDKTKIGNTMDAGICMQCHDAPSNHSIGRFWAESKHATMPLSGEEASRTACWPCHNGPALVAVQKNPAAPVYTNILPQTSISCQSCHDPHDATNEAQLRIAQATPLMNKFAISGGGMGNVCMTCHRSRYDSKAKVESQARVFGDRYYDHYSPQTDMYWGTNAYDFGQDLSGLMTHEGAENACVTCHMSDRAYGTSTSYRPDHSMNMVSAAGKDKTTGCVDCHGEITDFKEIRAMYDYDGDDKIESTIDEVAGLMAQLKAALPHDAAGEVVTMKADSVAVKTHSKWGTDGLTLLGAMWNYSMVKADASGGVHNAKFAVAILKLSLSKVAGPVGIDLADQKNPSIYALGQNYPNPVNLSTNINFSLVRSGHVRLHVYNMAGQIVATLADGQMAPGNYTTNWNGANLAAGMYIYRMSVESNGQMLYTATRKMSLVK
jgi:predicted CXXCH cytochrome family protein